jgi:hypothetical protein
MNHRSLFRNICLEADRADPSWICKDCLGNKTLKSLGSFAMEEYPCIACTKPSVDVVRPDRLADKLYKILPKYFCIASEHQADSAMNLNQIIGDMIESDSEIVCKAIADRLRASPEETQSFYSATNSYVLAPSPIETVGDLQSYVTEQWNEIKLDLMHGRRFFNKSAYNFFETLIFEALKAKDGEFPEKTAVILDLPVGTSFYRARVASNIAQALGYAKDAETELGAPPRERAVNGRMSASGVSLLYIAKDLETCIAETRPSIDDIVVVGRFFSTTPLRLFDFGALKNEIRFEPLDRFHPWAEKLSVLRKFLDYLHGEIAKPVRVNDQDYVMTQALAEFIRYFQNGYFDGISFQSVQHSGGVNYVLFGKEDDLSTEAPTQAKVTSSVSMQDRRLKFDVSLKPEDVTLHRVQGLSYTSKPIAPL